MSARRRLEDLLVVEFCDTKDEHGVYRKYSAYKIGDRVLPRYLECSRDWMVKWDWRIFDRVRADEETRYLETDPHEAWIREIFALARIDYGRIDYGVLDWRAAGLGDQHESHDRPRPRPESPVPAGRRRVQRDARPRLRRVLPEV